MCAAAKKPHKRSTTKSSYYCGEITDERARSSQLTISRMIRNSGNNLALRIEC